MVSSSQDSKNTLLGQDFQAAQAEDGGLINNFNHFALSIITLTASELNSSSLQLKLFSIKKRDKQPHSKVLVLVFVDMVIA